MFWRRRINDVLEKEPETWLAYLCGQRIQDLKHLQDKEPRYKGIALRFLIYIYTLLRRTKVCFSPRRAPTTYLVYAGSMNQLSALESTVASLEENGQRPVVVIPVSLSNKINTGNFDYQVMTLGVVEFVRVLALTATRLRSVFHSVKAMGPDALRSRFDIFLQPHIDLVFFDRLLSYSKPRFVIVSKDHNVSNRSLLALARQRGIKTVYMQHASVSNLFPAINVDYAFLDGFSAYETYLKCETNFPKTDNLLKNRKVILSGQKKSLRRADNVLSSDLIGVAVNALDHPEDIRRCVENLNSEKFGTIVRFHPGMAKKTVSLLKASLNTNTIGYSDPNEESVGEFLGRISALVAGNSSIHLESALCGVPSIYHEISTTDMPDYYGYVQNGVALSASRFGGLICTLKGVLNRTIGIDADAVRFYSATYKTEWEQREGQLVVHFLLSMEEHNDIPKSVEVIDL